MKVTTEYSQPAIHRGLVGVRIEECANFLRQIRTAVLIDSGVKVFQIETTLNTDTFPSPFGFLAKREWEWSPSDRMTYLASTKALKRTPTRLARKIFHSIEAPHQMTSVQAGDVEAVHRITTEHVYKQQLVEVN